MEEKINGLRMSTELQEQIANLLLEPSDSEVEEMEEIVE